MKNKLIFIILFLILFFPKIGIAEVVNKCENSLTGCAFCVYNLVENTGCQAKFSVTYKSDATTLQYETYSSGSTSGYVSCTFSYFNFKKNDFLDGNGNVICPKAVVDSQVTGGSGRTGYKKVTFSSGANGTLSATSESKIVNKTTEEIENPSVQESYSCQYGNVFRVSVIDGNINVTLNGYDGFQVSTSVDVNLFKNNNCPDLYYYPNTRGSKIFSIHDEYPMGSYTKISGKLLDENTGTEVPETPVTTPENTQSDYVDKINYNSLCENRNIKQTMKLIGYLVQVVRWIVPLIIIVLGMIDFGKASIESDDKALSKATASLIRRFVAGVVVFFIPTIVLALLNAIEITKGIEDETNSQFGACTKCIFGAHKTGYCEISTSVSGEDASNEDVSSGGGNSSGGIPTPGGSKIEQTLK